MTQEEKELLLQDLCARLPYHVKCKIWLKDETTEEGLLDLQHNYGNVLQDAFYYNIIKDIKPYLRSMSSITEEERDEMKRLLNPDGTGWFTTEGFIIPASHYGDTLDYSFLDDIRDYLDSKHFDHRGLIPKGLALEAKEGMYNVKEK